MGGEFTVVSCASIVDAEPMPSRHLRWPVVHAAASDDYAALAEGLRRRYDRPAKRRGSSAISNGASDAADALPDLILIDGGKGQLSAARRALASTPAAHVPLVALAKGNETVYTYVGPAGDVSSLPIDEAALLPADDPELDTSFAGEAEWNGPAGSGGRALVPPPGGGESTPMLLLRRSRDEAHNTALAGHRYLRESAALASAIDSLGTVGVGASRRAALLRHFGTLEALCAASTAELQEVPGIGAKLAEKLSRTIQLSPVLPTPRTFEQQAELLSTTTPDAPLVDPWREGEIGFEANVGPRFVEGAPGDSPAAAWGVEEVAVMRMAAGATAATAAIATRSAERMSTGRLSRVNPLVLPEDPRLPGLSATAAAIARPRKGRRPDATRKRAGASSAEEAARRAEDSQALIDALGDAMRLLVNSEGSGGATSGRLATEATVGAAETASASMPAAAAAAVGEVGTAEQEAAREARAGALDRFVHRVDRRAHRPFEIEAPWPPSAEQSRVVTELADAITSGQQRMVLKGATGTGKTYAMSQLIARTGRPALVLAPNKVLAAQLWAELRGFLPKNAVEYFVSYYDYYRPESYQPTADVYLAKTAAVNEDIDRMRHAATASLLSRSDVVVVASVSCIYGLGVPDLYEAEALSLRVGETVHSLDDLTTRLDSGLQYLRLPSHDGAHAPPVPSRGEYSIETIGDASGYLLSVHPIGSETLVTVKLDCIEADGDRFEELSADGTVAADSEEEAAGEARLVVREVRQQVMSDSTEEPPFEDMSGGLMLFPSSHHVLPEAERARVLTDIRAELEVRLADLQSSGRDAEASRLAERVKNDLEDFATKGYCKGLENYSRHLCGRPAGSAPLTLLDYFPEDFTLLVDESHVALPQLRAMYPADRKRKLCLVEHGFRLPSALDNRPLNHDEFWERVPSAVFVSATPGAYEVAQNELIGPAGAIPELVLRPTGIVDPTIEIRPRGSQLDQLIAEASVRAERGERTLATCLTRTGAERLSELLCAHGLPAAYMHSGTKPLDRVRVLQQLRDGEIAVLVGVNLLREGLDLPEVSLVAVLDADKEGFLRSTTSLIQTIGRAARHLDGRAILFADRITRSMQNAIDETDRRRAVQQAHNTLNGITPRSASSAGAGSALMLQMLDEARRNRDAAAERSRGAGGGEPPPSRQGFLNEPATKAPPQWLVEAQTEQQIGSLTLRLSGVAGGNSTSELSP